jgi:hypothetical protein
VLSTRSKVRRKVTKMWYTLFDALANLSIKSKLCTIETKSYNDSTHLDNREHSKMGSKYLDPV